MATFIDTNVLIYLTKKCDDFHAWAKEAVAAHRRHGPIIISDIVYCEFSVAMKDVRTTNSVIKDLTIERLRFSDAALYDAAQAFKLYKSRKGNKQLVLPDFLIGAQANAESAALITGNARDYKSYFPNLKLVTPG